MRYIADLHIHSYYSRATSKKLNLEHIFKWGQIKGLTVIATGDITHPLWLEEMRTKLEPTQHGFFRLRQEYAQQIIDEVPDSCRSEVYFILSGEISNIYKRDDAVRKIHHVVFMPSFEAVERFQHSLDRIGNIHSDGRPILGLDSRDLLEIVLETDEEAHLVPAHIWTPWFSLLGSKSGFDSMDACFGDLTKHIFAVETGLSSDPPMNWRLSELDRYTLVSNSDAHSPEKLAREANVFDAELNYIALFAALKNKSDAALWGTIEFFPEEGKYHMDGHRKCAQMLRPAETIAKGGLCPVCGKPVTIGVNHRVEILADRPDGARPDGTKPFMSLVPLPEVLAEVQRVGAKSKRVQEQFHTLLRELGSELHILMDCPLPDIERVAGTLTAEGVRRMREGEVYVEPGYDGEYGIVRMFRPGERELVDQQESLFFDDVPDAVQQKNNQNEEPPASLALAKPRKSETEDVVTTMIHDSSLDEYGLNVEQIRAVHHRGSPLIIHAGPGTGKTRTLTHRLAELIKTGVAKPEEVLAITFTNKAAAEMRERLRRLLGEEKSGKMRIQTFHAFGASLLREMPKFFGRTHSFHIIDVWQESTFIESLKANTNVRITNAVIERISRSKGELNYPEHLAMSESHRGELQQDLASDFIGVYREYERLLVERDAVDYDDLISLPVRLLRNFPDKRRETITRFPVVAVDEFQDINRAQYELFKLLALAAREVCVVGDPDQAIYGFRGASSEFFVKFQEDFPNAVAVTLNRSYRSATNILKASRQILARPSEEQTKLWSNIAPDVKIHFHCAQTDRAEAEFVVHRIEQMVGGTSYFSIDSKRVDEDGLPHDYSFSDFAILVRTKQLGAPLTEALARSGIPFESLSEESVSSEEVVRFLITALRSIYHKHTDDYLKEFGFDDFARIAFNTIQQAADEFTAIEDYAVRDILENIWKVANIEKWPGLSEPNSLRQRILRLAQPFGGNIDEFFDTLMLQKKIDDFDERAERVHLLTLHAAKGLEFPVVFIVGCEEGILPLTFGEQASDLAEERRLLYVGMTRAERQLTLCHSKKRFWRGKTRDQKPSRFLRAISEALIHQKRMSPRKAKKGNGQLKLF